MMIQKVMVQFGARNLKVAGSWGGGRRMTIKKVMIHLGAKKLHNTGGWLPP